MKAYESYGSKCNGCKQYAEYCNCKIDSKTGELLEIVPNPKGKNNG